MSVVRDVSRVYLRRGARFSILMYADDIILLAPSVSALQHLLDVCESELQYLDVYQRQQIGLYQGWLASCTTLS